MSDNQLSRVGSLWLDAYSNSFNRYVESAGHDIGSLCEAAYKLKSFYERCPEQGELSRQLALSTMNLSQQSAPRAVMALLGETALRASMVKPLHNESEAGAIRELLLVPCQMKERRLFDALDHLERCQSYLSRITSTPFGRWATAQEALLRGNLSVESFEFKAAERHYRQAHAYAAYLLADGAALDSFCRTWVDLVAPPLIEKSEEQNLEELEANPRWDVRFIALYSQQSAAAIARSDQQPEAIRAALDGFQRLGKVHFVRPLLWVQALATLPADERRAFCELFRDMVENWNAYFFAAREDNPPPADFLERAGFSESTEINLADIAEINVVEKLAQIESCLITGGLSKAKEAWYEQIQDIVETKMSFPMLYAFGQQLRFSSEYGKEEEAHSLHQFLQLLGGIVFDNHEMLLDPHYRSMIDPAIELATIRAVENIPDETPDTAVPSALFALQRSPSVTLFPPLIGYPEQERSTCEKGIEILADTLKRIRWGLSEWDDALVLISQKSDTGVTFICCESGDAPPRVIIAEQAFVDAMYQLNEAAVKAEGSNLPSAQAELEQRARQAFLALSKDARALIRGHTTILLVPDYSANHDALPFELIHDGHGFLLSQVVIARFTSLQHLAGALERRTITPGKLRALVIGIKETKSREPLPLAERERHDVCAMLESAGFDAPEIKPERISSRFITDRLSFVDLLHISGHGESAMGTDRLILPDGSWLDTLDLERHPQPSWPFVYLNTCELGETRYLGGGRGRGLAFTLAELGAPAILAHSARVFDDVSAAFATAFYRQALELPVGEALRCARKELLKSYPAAEIGRLVLLGNPEHMLPGVKSDRQVNDPTSDLLDQYFDWDADQMQRSEALTSIMLNPGRKGNPRLEAAGHLVMSREEAMHANEGNDPTRLRDAIALAEALNHRSSAALFKYKLAQLSAKAKTSDATTRLRAVLRDMTVLARIDSRWESHRKKVIDMINRLELEQRGIDFSRLQKETSEDTYGLQGFVNSIVGIQSLWEIKSAELRDIENSIEDIVWNAVLAGYGNRFEDVTEKVTFTRALVDKLMNRGELGESAQSSAIPILVAILGRAWTDRHENYARAEFAEAHTANIIALLEEIRIAWSPPDDQQWYHVVRDFPDSLDTALERIDAAGWEGGYKILDPEMNALHALAAQTLDQVVSEYPERIIGCVAFIAGCFATRVKFAPGEADSHTDERLKLEFSELCRGLDSMIAKGYESLGDREEDELMRWRAEGI